MFSAGGGASEREDNKSSKSETSSKETVSVGIVSSLISGSLISVTLSKISSKLSKISSPEEAKLSVTSVSISSSGLAPVETT